MRPPEVATLDDRDDVQRPIQLAIAASTQSMALALATLCFERRHASVGGQTRGSREPLDVANDPNDLRGADAANAVQRQERWRQLLGESAEVGLQCRDQLVVDRGDLRELSLDEVTCRGEGISRRGERTRRKPCEPGPIASSQKRALCCGLGVPLMRVELIQGRRTRQHEVVSMLGQGATAGHVAVGGNGREVGRVAEDHACDGEREGAIAIAHAMSSAASAAPAGLAHCPTGRPDASTATATQLR